MSRIRSIICIIIIISKSETTQSSSSVGNNYPSKSMTGAGMVGVGGGAINEKTRYYTQPHDSTKNHEFGNDTFGGWNPNENLAHLLHALVGLDRYPNYLDRIRDSSDIDSLENALESKLSDVRRQRSEIIQRRRDIYKLVVRYTSSTKELSDEVYDSCQCNVLWCDHPLLAPPKTWTELRHRKILTEQAFKVAHQSAASTRKARNAKSGKATEHTSNSLGDIIDGKVQVHLIQSLLEDFLCQETFDVYSFPLLTNEFCCLLRTTLRNLSALAESDEFAHLNLGRRPIDLDSIGLGWITDLLFHMFIHPISHHLFATTEMLTNNNTTFESQILDWRQGYVAGYSANPMESEGSQRNFLVPHTDDSEVTLNCCLGEETFSGGNVEFHGLRSTPEEGKLIGTVRRPNVGTAILHSGRHLHSVTNVVSGDRYALVVWSRSWGNLRAHTCPCCWMNRRQDLSCICGQRWN